MRGDKKDKQPSRCPGGNPRVQIACQSGGLDVKGCVEEVYWPGVNLTQR